MGQPAIPIYYTPVDMPAFLQNEYYGGFDTKLLATDLAGLLQQATGRTCIALPMNKKAKSGVFLLLDSTLTHTGNEQGFVYCNGKDRVGITARYATGLSYAMYSWLDELGFHFYLPGKEWTIIPSRPRLFARKFKKSYQPFFKLRMFNTSGGIFPVKGLDEKGRNKDDWRQWHIRNRMGSDYISIDGHIGELFNIVHKKEIEQDSLILAPLEGVRRYDVQGKLDPTYPAGVALFADWIAESFKTAQTRWPAFLPFKKYYSADAGDGLNYCHTPACEAQFGSVSTQSFFIANKAARKVREADSRGGVSTLAYTERADTPGIAIDPNVHVMVVPTGFQSVSTPVELMQRWAKKTSTFSQYDFLNIGVWAYDAPFFNLDAYLQHLRFLQSLHVEGMNLETSLSKFSSGIQQYFILKFLCEPNISPEKIFDTFCKDNFGNASRPVKELLREWYFSDTHLNTGYDKVSFYEDELARFVGYLAQATKAAAGDQAALKRISELKGYLVYLCKFYERFTDLGYQQKFKTDTVLKNNMTLDLLTYTWQLYDTKIFHNTQLNDMLKKNLDKTQAAAWDFRNSERFKDMRVNTDSLINKGWQRIQLKYLPLALQVRQVTDETLQSLCHRTADSIFIETFDETAFGYYMYPLPFYCNAPGPIRIYYEAGESAGAGDMKDKIAIVEILKEDYSYINTRFIFSAGPTGTLTFDLPAKGRYILRLSQYHATKMNYVLYPGKNLFYVNKKSIPMNGIRLQYEGNKNYDNKRLAFLAPADGRVRYSLFYTDASNTIQLFDYKAASIPTAPFPGANVLQSENKIAAGQLIYYENEVFRWPPVIKNTAPYYFFLKNPAP